MQSDSKIVLVIYKASGRKIAEILSNFNSDVTIYSIIKPKNVILSKLIKNYSELKDISHTVYFLPTEDDQIKLLYPFFLGCKIKKKVWLNAHYEYFDIITSKLRFKKFASSHGFKTAKVCLSITEIDKHKKYVCKLDSSYGSAGIQFLNGIEITERNFEVEHRFIEEHISFDEYIGISGYANNGTVSKFLSHRRIVTKDRFGGASRVCEKFGGKFDEIELCCAAVLSDMRFSGPFMFELGLRGHVPYLIEFNPRLWGSFSLFLNEFSQFFKIEKRFRESQYLVVWSDFKFRTFLWLARNINRLRMASFSPKLSVSAVLIFILSFLT